MRLGVQVGKFAAVGVDAAIGAFLAATARRAEEAGLASLWVMDHFFQIPTVGAAEEPMLEAYTALGFAAAATRRIRLGALVTGVTHRHPGVLVKTVTTLDVLSGGRACLGLGAAWWEREHAGLGIPFPPVAERFERLEETIRVAKQMWSGESKPYQGKHYRLAETLCRPLPLSRPHPPIWIGGDGERKTLRLVARYGDACNLHAFDPDLRIVRRKLDVLHAHCEAAGRPYPTVTKTTIGLLPLSRDGRNGSLTPAAALDRLGRLAELGIEEHIICQPPDDPAWFELLATEVMPALGADAAPA